MNVAALTQSQWGMIFILLSLDEMAPFYEPMGLQLRDKKGFRQSLRRLILENRKIHEQNPDLIPNLADRVLAEMHSVSGAAETEHFYNWAISVYNEIHADQPQWSAWEILFFRASYNTQARATLGLPPDKREDILQRYHEAISIADVEEEIKKVKTENLSDWDLEMYAIHQLSHDNLSDPFEIIERVVKINRFQLFWEKVLPQLSVEEKVRLWRQSQSLLRETGIWMPEGEDLLYPDSLRRQI